MVIMLPTNSIGELCEGKLHAQFDEEVEVSGQTPRWAPPLYSTIKVVLFDGSMVLNTSYLDVFSNHLGGIKYNWRISEPDALGLHKIRAVLGNEEKNITVQVDPRPRPYVYVVKIDVDSVNITVGKTMVITAVIANNGTADASNETVKFYDGAMILGTMKANISAGKTVTLDYNWNTTHVKVGRHTLKVSAGSNEKDTTVNVNKGPPVFLGSTFAEWFIALIVIIIVIISIICIYFYRRQKHHHIHHK